MTTDNLILESMKNKYKLYIIRNEFYIIRK